MAELDLVAGCISREIQFAVECGNARLLGNAIGDGITETLAAALRPNRDQLAAMAMQALVARVGRVVGVEKDIAGAAYLMADAMLAEREKGAGRG